MTDTALMLKASPKIPATIVNTWSFAGRIESAPVAPPAAHPDLVQDVWDESTRSWKHYLCKWDGESYKRVGEAS